MEVKLRLKRHESFSIREGWLVKGIKNVQKNGNVFSLPDATDLLGIGTNMVKSLKYWLLATNLIEEKNKTMELSQFGELINEFDPYLEDLFSWWLIHINLITNEEDAYIYNLFFNECQKNVFNKKDVYQEINNILLSKKINFNEKILEDEINMIMKMYSIDEKIDNPENNFICPLSELNLIKKIEKDVYERNKPEIKSLNYLIVYYLILLNFKDRESFSIEELVSSKNDLTKILNLDKNLINEYLDEIKRNDFIIINRTAGLNMIYFKEKMSLEKIMEKYFKGGQNEI